MTPTRLHFNCSSVECALVAFGRFRVSFNVSLAFSRSGAWRRDSNTVIYAEVFMKRGIQIIQTIQSSDCLRKKDNCMVVVQWAQVAFIVTSLSKYYY